MTLPAFAAHPRILLAEIRSTLRQGTADPDWAAVGHKLCVVDGGLKTLQSLYNAPEMAKLLGTMNSTTVAVGTRSAGRLAAEVNSAIRQFDALKGALALGLEKNASAPVRSAAAGVDNGWTKSPYAALRMADS